MRRTDSPAQAMLEHWRANGADRLNRVRFHFIEALHRRAASQTGEARRMLDQRLDNLLAAYASAVDGAAAAPGLAPGSAPPDVPARSALGDLLADIASQPDLDAGSATDGTTGSATGGGIVRHFHATFESTLLDDVRATWSRVSAEKQLRQSLEQVPVNAGPLNSSSLVHRSLLLMRDVSPAYLRQFLSYVDALSWLERLDAAGGQDASRSGAGVKSTRGKVR